MGGSLVHVGRQRSLTAPTWMSSQERGRNAARTGVGVKAAGAGTGWGGEGAGPAWPLSSAWAESAFKLVLQ